MHEIADAGCELTQERVVIPSQHSVYSYCSPFYPAEALSWLRIGRGGDLVERARRQVTKSPRSITIGVATEMGKK